MKAPDMWTIVEADAALEKLLHATIAWEKALAARDTDVEKVQRKYGAAIADPAEEIATLEQQLQEFFVAQREKVCPPGKKSVQLGHGLLGLRAPSSPALLPLNDKWTWKRIAARLKRLFKQHFFLPPKPPGLDKVKIKRELSAEQLAECGLKLDDTETFYVELSRLPKAA